MKHVDEPAKMQKTIIKYTLYIGGILLAVFLLKGEFKFFLGLLFGLLISILILRLKFLHIIRSLNMKEDKATTFIRNRYFIEYIIYFVVLIVAFKNTGVNFVATIAGLFLMKFTIISWAIVDIIRN